MRDELFFIFQFIHMEKTPVLILFDIPKNNFVQTYHHIHRLYVKDEKLICKKHKDFDVDCAVFDLGTWDYDIRYVFMTIRLPKYNGHTEISLTKSVNLQNVAYNIAYDVEEVWRKE